MRLRNDLRQQKEDERAQHCQRNGGRENGGSPALLPALLLKGGFLRRARALLRDGGELRLRDGAENVHVGEHLLPRKRRAADAAAVTALRIPRAAAAAPRAVQHQWREAQRVAAQFAAVGGQQLVGQRQRFRRGRGRGRGVAGFPMAAVREVDGNDARAEVSNVAASQRNGRSAAEILIRFRVQTGILEIRRCERDAVPLRVQRVDVHHQRGNARFGEGCKRQPGEHRPHALPPERPRRDGHRTPGAILPAGPFADAGKL